MGKTAIAWTNERWNPLRGCTVYTKECTNCYAMAKAVEPSLGGPGKAYEGLTKVVNGEPVWNGTIRLVPEKLKDPLLRQRKPARVFVNSMSDLFHEDVPEEYIHEVFAVMAKTKQHTFQVLTKRAERLLELSDRVNWPENVWMGTSIGCQENAYKAELLAKTGAKVKWVSAEPLIDSLKMNFDGIHWVVIGGESGQNARPMDLDCARSLKADCEAVGVAVFMKQLGSVWAKDFKGDKKGAIPGNWAPDLRVREYPEALRNHGGEKGALEAEQNVLFGDFDSPTRSG